jgi:hypothetical protein
MPRDAANALVGRVRYEMDFAPDGDLRVTSQPNESNVRSFSGSFVIRGSVDVSGPGAVLDQRRWQLVHGVLPARRELQVHPG